MVVWVLVLMTGAVSDALRAGTRPATSEDTTAHPAANDDAGDVSQAAS